jgi:hypothetical protein
MLIWARVVCGSTVCRLAYLVVRVFPSHLGAGVWQWPWGPPGFPESFSNDILLFLLLVLLRFFFFFLAVPVGGGVELRVSHLLGRYSTPYTTSSILFYIGYF